MEGPSSGREFVYHQRYWDSIQDLDKTVASKVTLDWLQASSSDRILDVGCGVGRYITALERSGSEVIGIELFRGPLEVARKRVSAGLINASAEYLPFREQTFDKVLCNHVLEHLHKPRMALDEIHRVLRRCGRLVLAYPNANYILFRLRLVRQDPSHKWPISHTFSDQRFKLMKRRIFLSIPGLHDRLFEIFHLSEMSKVSQFFYNVVALMEKA